MQELKVYQPLNLTSSGEKVALTQVVEHHLPTYASLALVKQKWEWKTCKKNRKWNESTACWKCNNNTRHLLNTQCEECVNSGARPTLSILSLFHCNPFRFNKKPLQGYQVVQLQYFRPPSKDGGGWEQPCGVDPAEETDSWGQLKSVREQNVSTIEVQSKLDQLKL